MRAAAALLGALVLAGCASKSPSPPAAPAGGTTSRARVSAPATTHLALPTQPPPPIDPCKLTAAQIGAVVGFAVVKQPPTVSGQCEYRSEPGGLVWFSVDSWATLDLARDKADETFSLGGRYVTITDETGFPHEAFTAVKNPGDKSPGVIADLQAFLAPGHLKLRIYYPQGGTPPGRKHALALAHLMLA